MKGTILLTLMAAIAVAGLSYVDGAIDREIELRSARNQVLINTIKGN